MHPVAVDAMGGDRAPEVVVEGAIAAAKEGYAVLLVGDEARIGALPRGLPITLRHAPDQVAMDEPPAQTVRRRPESSVRVALRAVKDGEASAALSCGNTGALVAAALLELGRVPGLSRPAVCAALPRADGGRLVLLDLGATVDTRPQQLAEFAVMGHVFARYVLGVGQPRVGLLSNGGESGKGNESVKAADAVLEGLPIDYVGPMEPTTAFRGGCDVLVCDGFVGNVLLKTAEATAELVAGLLKREVLREPGSRVAAWMLAPAMRRLRGLLDYKAAGGGQLLGVNGVVVVGHGRSDARAVTAAIRHAHHCAGESLGRRVAEGVAWAFPDNLRPPVSGEPSADAPADGARQPRPG